MVDHLEKCIMQSVLNVEKNVKFHSNLTEEDLFTAESVMLNEDPREEIDTKLQCYYLGKQFFYHKIFYYFPKKQKGMLFLHELHDQRFHVQNRLRALRFLRNKKEKVNSKSKKS